MSTQSDKEQVQGLIRDWASAFGSVDIDRIKGLWDQDYSQLIYIAEENNDHLSSWSEINGYYDAFPSMVNGLDMNIDNVTVDVIGDAAYGYLTFVAKADIKGVDNPMTFQGRNTFVLRKTGDAWKIIHYHESLSRDRSHETWGFMWS